jgi:prepilin-type processing-associated H-X9-DG protein
VQGYLNPRVAADDLSNERLLTDASYAQLAPYLPRASIYHCPSDRGTERIRSYAMNAYVGWVGPVQRPLQAGHRIYRHWEDLDQPGPAKLMVFIDVRPESICWPFFGITMVSDAGGQFFAFPATHHADGAQVAFADGHVERKRWSDPRTLRPGNLLYHAHDTPSPGNSDLAWLRSVATVRH